MQPTCKPRKVLGCCVAAENVEEALRKVSFGYFVCHLTSAVLMQSHIAAAWAPSAYTLLCA